MPEPIQASTVVPMKVNAFEMAAQASTQLLPLFPYAHRGAIVPCSIAIESDGKGMSLGYFVHTNSVDEVAVTLASNGPMPTGDVFVGPRSHGVGGGATIAFFRVGVVTQRQLEAGEQPEGLTFQCEKCNTVLLRHAIDVLDVNNHTRFDALPSNVLANDAAVAFNASEEVRTCSSCGHVNPPFPLQIWGWSRYVRNSGIAQKGWDAVQDLQAEGAAA